VRVKGKLIWKTLKSDRLAVAKLRLGDFLKEENHRGEVIQSAARGKMNFGDAVTIYRQQLADAQQPKARRKTLPRKNHQGSAEKLDGVGKYRCSENCSERLLALPRLRPSACSGARARLSRRFNVFLPLV
jgi:hypothetical protein